MLNKHLCRLLRVVPVALHQRGAVNAEFAVLALNFLRCAGFNGHHFNIVSGNANAALRRLTQRIRKRADGNAFRKPVTGNEMAFCAVFLKQAIHFFRKGVRHNVSAGADQLHIAHIDALKVAGFIHFFKEIRNAEDIIQMIFLDCLRTHFGVKLRPEGLRHANAHGNMHAKRETKTVEHGKRGQHTVMILIDLHIQNSGNNIHQFIGKVVDIFGREHNALGVTGCAARHHDRGSGGVIRFCFRNAVFLDIRIALF